MSKTKNNYLLVAISLIAMSIAGLGSYGIVQNTVTAQQEMAQNNTSSMTQPVMNFSSSINVKDVLSESLKSKITVTLSDAIGIAQTTIGQGSFAKEAGLETKYGYMVYEVKVSDAQNEKHKVFIDPGTGEVIKTKKLDYEHGLKMGGDKYGDKKYGGDKYGDKKYGGDKYGDKYKKDRW